MSYPDVHWQLPPWVARFVADWHGDFRAIERRAEFVIGLAGQNVRHGTGGPFAAAVFSTDAHRLLAPGVNLVLTATASSAHAEIIALSIAQRLAGSFDLAACGDFELVTSTAPCAMCLGAIGWSGVRRLVCCARGEDAEAIGFDEGAKPVGWSKRLAERGVRVTHDVRREEAVAVLEEYASAGGTIYNAGRSN